jgi:hypothetical protein
MFQFTDTYGYAVDAPSDVRPALGSDVTYLPILLAAAKEADEAGYCEVYDNIAQAIGGPTRQDLRDAGLLTRAFTVEVSRTVRVYTDHTQSTSVTVDAANMREAREQVEEGNVELDWPSVDGADVRYNGFDIDDDDASEEVDRVYAS